MNRSAYDLFCEYMEYEEPKNRIEHLASAIASLQLHGSTRTSYLYEETLKEFFLYFNIAIIRASYEVGMMDKVQDITDVKSILDPARFKVLLYRIVAEYKNDFENLLIPMVSERQSAISESAIKDTMDRHTSRIEFNAEKSIKDYANEAINKALNPFKTLLKGKYGKEIECPNVFISYSNNSWNRVKELANKLKSDHINVVVDAWGDDTNIKQFIDRLVSDNTIDRVLVICDADFTRKAHEDRNFVSLEWEIMKKHPNEKKYIQVAFEKDEQGKFILPSDLKFLYCYDLSDFPNSLDGYNKLIRFIWDQPKDIEPHFGSIPK